MSDLEKLIEGWKNATPEQMLRSSLPQGDEIEQYIEVEKARIERERRERENVEAAKDQQAISAPRRKQKTDSSTGDEEEADSGELEEFEEASDLEQQSQSEHDSEYGGDDGMSRAPSKPSSSRPSRPKASISTQGSTLKNEALASAISVKARLPSCAIGAVEMMTFFPLHDQWPEAGLRLFRNGWKNADVAKIQLFARDTLTKEAYVKRRDALKWSVIRNGEIFFEVSKFAPTKQAHLVRNAWMTPVTTYDATSYRPRDKLSSYLMDAKLIEIAQGVVNWPMGEDRGIVTQAIEYAYQHNLGQYTSADIPQLAQQMGLALPSEASRTDWDQRALQRVKQIAGP